MCECLDGSKVKIETAYREGTKWQRCIGCLIYIGHFPQKSPMISGFSAERDQRFEASYASLPQCIAVANRRSLSMEEPLIVGLFCRK